MPNLRKIDAATIGEGECKTCGIRLPLPSRPDRAVLFCSAPCRNKAKVHPKGPVASKWEDRTCPVDGTVFRTRRYKPKMFCSIQCFNRQPKTKKSNPEKKADATCPECGKTFSYYKSWTRIFCSIKCSMRSKGREAMTTRIETTCEICGVTILRAVSLQPARFCSSACYGQWVSLTKVGENSPNWRGGYLPYYGGSWRRARRQARERDGHCMDCGLTPEQHGKSLDVHHLVPFRTFGVVGHKEANQLDNLVALCPQCHIAREWADNWREARA